MGIYVGGGNANVGFIGYCQALGPGSFTPGKGGHGFWDQSLSSCLWINNYAEDGSGAGWISECVGKATWVNNVSEMPIQNIVRQGTVMSLGNSSWHPTMLQEMSNFDLHEGSRIATTDRTSRVTGFTQRGFQGWVDIFSTTDEQDNFLGRTYNKREMGWYTDHLWGTNGAFIGGVSGLMAADGPGHPWVGAGTFVGDRTKRYFGYDRDMWESNRLREGKRTVGDLFITNPYAGPGEWMGIVVTKAGTKGLAWQPDQQYYQKQVGVRNLPADMVEPEPKDGFAYACTRSGKSGGQPPFIAGVAIGPNAPVWSGNTRYWPSSKVRPTAENGHCYQMKQYPAWSANTNVVPNQIITTGDSNGNLFLAYVQEWSKGGNVATGQYMQPKVPNGKVYRVKHVAGLTFAASTGEQEPVWSKLVLPTDELEDGGVIWQLDQLKTGKLEPPGVVEGVVGWDTRPGFKTYDNNIEWLCFVPMTGDVEPNWNTINESETVDTPGARVGANGSVEHGFGVIWVESGLDPIDAKVWDNECEWTRIDVVPETASVLLVGPANAPQPLETMSLTINRLSLTNVDDTAGRWQFEGGEVFRNNEHIANYASAKRLVIEGTEAQNTAMLTLTLFFIGQSQQPPENMTLQGSHDFGSGAEIGSVSAASATLISYIGKQFRRSGTALIIQ
jgi:hypothetical protein